MVPRRDALLGSTFDTRKILSRCPAIASATTSSASPYISAVSMWVMPRSMPRRSAATAFACSRWSMSQVPCPITDTCGPFCPNFCFLTTASDTRYSQPSSPGLTGRSSIPETPERESRSCGVLDTPLARGMTALRRSHLSLGRIQNTDICNQNSPTRRLRHVEAVAIGAANGDIGAGRSGAGFDARDQLAILCEHEHMSERCVRHEQPARLVHRQAIGAAGAEGGTEAADLGNAAVLHKGQAPDRVVARHRHKQHGLGGIEHQAVGADAGVDQAI